MANRPEPETPILTTTLSVDALIHEIEQAGWAYRLEGQCLMRDTGGVCRYWMHEATVEAADGREATREVTTAANALLGALRGVQAAGDTERCRVLATHEPEIARSVMVTVDAAARLGASDG